MVVVACLPAVADDWRVRPIDVDTDAADEDLLASLDAGADGSVTGASGQVSLSLLLPEAHADTMLTFARHPRPSFHHLSDPSVWVAEVSSDARLWREVDRCDARRGGLERVVIGAHAGAIWLRLRLQSAATPARLTSIGLYSLRDGTGDVWLALGASIQEAGFEHAQFKAQVRARWGADPVTFNRAVSGWTTVDLVAALPELLAEHPEARWVAIHIGGNNVTRNRPFPGGAPRIRADLIRIIDMVRAAGKEPVLARLSYRAYRSPPRVGPERLGARPYVDALYDPLIAHAMPRFFDHGAGRGRVDPYEWYRTHPDELGADGVHPNSRGLRSWVDLWVEGAGAVVYGM